MQEAQIELLQRMPIFGEIGADILQFLLGLCPIVSVPTNEFFFRQHDQGNSMLVLELGKAAVLKSWRGQDTFLHTLKEGDCFGEMAVMDHCPRSASIRAVEDCIAIHISAANLYEVYAQDLKQFALIQMNMGREVCRRLREADNRLFSAKMGTPETEIEHVFLGLRNAAARFAENKTFRPATSARLGRELIRRYLSAYTLADIRALRFAVESKRTSTQHPSTIADISDRRLTCTKLWLTGGWSGAPPASGGGALSGGGRLLRHEALEQAHACTSVPSTVKSSSEAAARSDAPQSP